MTRKLPTRAESDPATQWRTQHIFDSDKSFLHEVSMLSDQCAKLAAYGGKLSQPQGLLQFLSLLEDTLVGMANAVSYAGCKNDEDTTNPTYQAFVGTIATLSVELHASLSFFAPEVLEMGESLWQMIDSFDELSPFRKYIDDVVRHREHTLDSEGEYLLSLAGDISGAAEEVFSTLNNADMKFGSIQDENGNVVEVTHGRYAHFLESTDRQVRSDAFDALYKAYSNHSHTLACLLNAHTRKNRYFKVARKYESSLEMCLTHSMIPTEVYTQLIGCVHTALPTFYRYIDLRRKTLGYDQLHMYDLYVPIVENPYKDLTYAQAQELVLEALAPLGSAYCERVKEAYGGGWIDVYENEGKRSGAYSNGAPACHPMILLNHQDNLDSAFTLAHELGHALHSDLTNRQQRPVYRNISIFVAEVASTVNEALLLHHLMERGGEREQKYLINRALENYRGTLFRQTMFAEFELLIHQHCEEGYTLTADLLDTMYGSLLQNYFGDRVEICPQIRKEWSRIPHFYYDFYVYQYATGFAAAQALTDRILSNNGLEDYLAFLGAGDSVYPLDALKIAGADLSTIGPIKSALSKFESLLSRLELMLQV